MTTPTPQRKGGRPWRTLRAQVLEQETVCHICHKWVDKTLTDPHPLSPTIDHVHPIATHPHLEYDRTNLRLAHRRCNLTKGAGTTPTHHTNTLNTSRPW